MTDTIRRRMKIIRFEGIPKFFFQSTPGLRLWALNCVTVSGGSYRKYLMYRNLRAYLFLSFFFLFLIGML